MVETGGLGKSWLSYLAVFSDLAASTPPWLELLDIRPLALTPEGPSRLMGG